jgi:hypothetical protein
VAEAVGEPAGGAGDDGRHRRPGQGGEPGAEHAVSPDRGEEEDVAEDQREEGGREEQRAEVADRKGAVGEQRRVDDRARMGAAADDDRTEQQRGGGESRERAGGGPTPVVPLDDPERDRGQAKRQHQRPGQVRQAAVGDRPLGQ